MRTYKYYLEPIPHFVIECVFPQQVADKMFSEVLSNESNFEQSVVGNCETDKELRTNDVLYLDNVYMGKRDTSVLLGAINGMFHDDEFKQLLHSSVYPLNEFGFTNTHESQVSRYGNDGQHYGWHVDRGISYKRHITAVYYFNDKRKWTGGDIEFTDSPIYHGNTLHDSKIKSIKPKPNSLIIFSSSVPHRVTKTKSPYKFDEGRFSINCWIGMK